MNIFTEQRNLVDRTTWTSGEWDNEPDRVSWIDPETGISCIANRIRAGTWCGYVAVRPGHSWHSVHYDGIAGTDVHAHGGLTYSGCDLSCFPAEDALNGLWFIGFDCAHAGDLMPGTAALFTEARNVLCESSVFGETYRNLEFVKQQCTSLALQAAKVVECGVRHA